MKIGIIETGEPPPPLLLDYGTYAAMTRRFLGASHTYETFRVFDGAFPSDDHGCDAFVITGSACGVKDGLPWVDDLIDFLRDDCRDVKLVGICFGHQVMAQAFGGDVAKAPQGWGLGLHRYEIVARADWMDDPIAMAVAAVWGTASHQDQVLTLPPRCRILAASAFTPNAILGYEDRPAVSVQFHPEFAPDFSAALFRLRRAPDLSPDQIEEAIASLARSNDNERLARWLNRFLAM